MLQLLIEYCFPLVKSMMVLQRLIPHGSGLIAEPLCRLFNLSVSMDTLPKDWGLGQTSSQYLIKKRSKHCPYSPISPTSIATKIYRS